MPDSRFFISLDAPVMLSELAALCGGEVAIARGGDVAVAGQTSIESVAPIDAASDGDITFLTNANYASQLKASSASACILSKKDVRHAPDGMALILHVNPHLAYATIAQHLHPDADLQLPHTTHISASASVDPSAVLAENIYVAPNATIGPKAEIGAGTKIDAGAVIGEGVVIGARCHIGANAVISHTITKDDVRIYPGAMIGQDGFGFATDMATGTHHTVPQLGRVLIGHHVHVGSNTTIDRGAGPDTVIGDSVRIDNLVQIGHNVQIGHGSVIVSHVGISGSTVLGKFCVIGGQAGIAGHLKLGDQVQVAAQSGLMNNVEAGSSVGGSPALPIKQWHRQTIAIRQLTKKPKKRSSAGGQQAVSPFKISMLSLLHGISAKFKK